MTLHDEDEQRRRRWIVYRPDPVIRNGDAIVGIVIVALAVAGLAILWSQ